MNTLVTDVTSGSQWFGHEDRSQAESASAVANSLHSQYIVRKAWTHTPMSSVTAVHTSTNQHVLADEHGSSFQS